MEKLLTLTNVEVPKTEFVKTLITLPSSELSRLRTCLFEEAKEIRLIHSNDVLVTRNCSSVRPITFAHADDIWNLATSLSNMRGIPRTLIKNGKRSKELLDSWRGSNRYHSGWLRHAKIFSCYLKLDGVQDSSEIIKKTKASIFIIFYLANIAYNIYIMKWFLLSQQ